MRTFFLLSAACFLAGSASAQKVKMVQYSKGADFNSFKTYQWLPVRALEKTGIVEDDPRLAPVVKESINQQLTAKGLTEVATGGDLQISVMALSESSPQMEAILFASPMDAALLVGTPIGTLGRYNKEGTLAVNLIDPKTNKSAWSALATSSIDTPERTPPKVRKAITKMFEHYPPKPKD